MIVVAFKNTCAIPAAALIVLVLVQMMFSLLKSAAQPEM
jgi:hypothetical protein